MPLIDLKTDLKSLKFGNDRPQGGSSNQPYIQTQIPDDDKQGIPSTEDFLLRGGLSAPLNAAKDVSRLTQMFFDLKDPSGLFFTAKENLLSRTAVKTEASSTAGTIYTPLSTLGQAAAGFAGGHLNLLGLDPTGLSSLGVPSYYDYVTKKINTGDEFNRLISLSDTSFEEVKLGNKLTLFPNGRGGNTFMEYGGGPGSILGIGKTRLNFTSNPTFNSSKRTWGEILTPYNSKSWSKEQIESAPANSGKETGNTSIQDFRRDLLGNSTYSTIMSSSPSYKTGEGKNIEERVNLGDPGKSQNVYSYATGGRLVDKINASGIYEAEIANHLGDKNDLVKFSIGVLQNNDTKKADFMHFRSFIDSFDDSYNASWGDTQYVGRGDKFHNYQGFDRSINMSFTVYAQSKAELIPMYEKLNFLASSLAPSYGEGGFMQGNLVYLTMGGYLFKQLGFIKSLTYTVPQESTWEIGIGDAGGFDDNVKELPHMIKVSGLSFTPIHDFLPRKAKPYNQRDTRFIALANGTNKENISYSETTKEIYEFEYNQKVIAEQIKKARKKQSMEELKRLSNLGNTSPIPTTPFNSFDDDLSDGGTLFNP
ncbi:hypothetical protein N9864_00115 [bacterium]|nr:hypothetical protein [bacterium]